MANSRAAGTWQWGWAWVYTLVSLIGWSALNLILAYASPGLLNVRGRPTKEVKAGAKSWDLIILPIYTLLMVALPIVAGLDYRFGWSGESPAFVHILGTGFLILGFVALTWAMAANDFFDPTVRIQNEKGHQVAEGGPYRIVRHPGYVGVILHFLAVPVALGMWVALIPALSGTALFVLRTALEDKTLIMELPGYAEYARRTRYRMVPGIW